MIRRGPLLKYKYPPPIFLGHSSTSSSSSFHSHRHFNFPKLSMPLPPLPTLLEGFDPFATHPFTNGSGVIPPPHQPSQYSFPVPANQKFHPDFSPSDPPSGSFSASETYEYPASPSSASSSASSYSPTSSVSSSPQTTTLDRRPVYPSEGGLPAPASVPSRNFVPSGQGAIPMGFPKNKHMTAPSSNTHSGRS